MVHRGSQTTPLQTSPNRFPEDIEFRERLVPEEMIQEILDLRLRARAEARQTSLGRKLGCLGGVFGGWGVWGLGCLVLGEQWFYGPEGFGMFWGLGGGPEGGAVYVIWCQKLSTVWATRLPGLRSKMRRTRVWIVLQRVPLCAMEDVLDWVEVVGWAEVGFGEEYGSLMAV